MSRAEMVGQIVTSLQENESAMAVMDAYFEKNKQAMSRIIGKWKKSDQEKQAFEFLYKAANWDKVRFTEFLEDIYEGIEESDNPKDHGHLKKIFRILNDHATGEMADESELYSQVAKVSVIRGDELKKQIGEICLERTNEFLKTLNPELYNQVANELKRVIMPEEAESAAANDNTAPDSDTVLRGAKKLKGSEQESEESGPEIE